MRGEAVAVHRGIPFTLTLSPCSGGEGIIAFRKPLSKRGVVYGHLLPSGLRVPHVFSRLVGKGQA